MVLRGTRWVIRVVIVVLPGQLGAIAGTTWELSHGIDARKASQLRQLGFHPTAGVVINLIYSSIGFVLFCWSPHAGSQRGDAEMRPHVRMKDARRDPQ